MVKCLFYIHCVERIVHLIHDTVLFSINHRQEEESSFSSSEEEDCDPHHNEDLYGKVVAVEDVDTGDKEKTLWFPALVSNFPKILLVYWLTFKANQNRVHYLSDWYSIDPGFLF